MSFIITKLSLKLDNFSTVLEYLLNDSSSLNGFPSVVAIATSWPLFFISFTDSQSNLESPLQSEI